jgi:MFS family permease
MNMLSDTKGRKFSFVLSLGIANIGVFGKFTFYKGLILGAYSKSIVLMVFSQIVIGFGGYAVMIIGYTIMSDLCKDSMRQKAILSMNGVW